MLPSKAYTEWHQAKLESRLYVKAKLGNDIPIAGPVSVEALIYRDVATGDLLGYLDAIADTIQCNAWTCVNPGKNVATRSLAAAKWKCHKRTVCEENPIKCPYCGWPAPKRSRTGLGLILDDKQIVSWDGSRLLIDRDRPRVELTLTEQLSLQVHE
jgi:hypothetical protein